MLKIFILKNRSISGIPCILSLQKAILVSRDFDISSPEILGGDHSCRNLKTISSKTNKISKINSKNNKTNRTKTKSKTDNILFIKQTGKETFLSRFVLLCIGSRKRPCAALGGTAIKSQLWMPEFFHLPKRLYRQDSGRFAFEKTRYSPPTFIRHVDRPPVHLQWYRGFW